MQRLSILLVLAFPLAGAQGTALDPAAPGLEFVMDKETGGLVDGTTFHYELHPLGSHEPVNGKFYGSSEFALMGFRQFVLSMPYSNPQDVLLEQGGPVEASFVFGVTNRGQGDYNVTWRLMSDGARAAEGQAKQFHLAGQGDDVGSTRITWTVQSLTDRLVAGANVSLEIDVWFSGNAPFIQDRGIVVELPPRPSASSPEAQPLEGGDEPVPEKTETDLPVAPEQVDAPAPATEEPAPSQHRDLTWLWVPAILLVGFAAMAWIQRRA